MATTATTTGLSIVQNEVLIQMQTVFNAENGTGMLMNDETYLRYLRARLV
jgi:hypothetical protein